ncbi:MAG TPA: cold shock domain-containing protein [Actinomycetes bacterium]|nr:cold shock domain-containing protein [Actinomycetes bacterium]
MVDGVVREWHNNEGWGVLDTAETPGGCWAHFASLRMAGFRTALPGQRVDVVYEQTPQDGYDFRAVAVTIEGVPVPEPATDQPDEPPSANPAYQSRILVRAGLTVHIDLSTSI